MSPALKAVLPKPPRVAFRNPKYATIVRSKIRENEEEEIFLVGIVTEICKILEPGKEFKGTLMQI